MEIFVFGSNLRGAHGAGAAFAACRKHGAKLGVGVGRTGNAYAIPTKGMNIKTLPLEHIEKYVKDFIFYAQGNPELHFNLTPVGCGLAGYKPEQIAPMFKDAFNLPNISFPEEFTQVLKPKPITHPEASSYIEEG